MLIVWTGLLTFPVKSFATNIVPTTICVEQKFDNSVEIENFYSIISLDSNEDSTRFCITGNDKKEVKFKHDKAGLYKYKISLDTSCVGDNIQYNTSAYFLDIYVYLNEENELKSNIVLKNQSSETKSDCAIFEFNSIDNKIEEQDKKQEQDYGINETIENLLPKTGDNIVFWYIILIISCIGYVILVFLAYKNKKE